MKPGVDPKGLRIVAAAIAFVVIACVVWQLPRFKARADERRVAAYMSRVQPLLSADPRFKHVKFGGYRNSGAFDPWLPVSGNVSNAETKRALDTFIQASQPPVRVSLPLLGTNEDQDWKHDRLWQLQNEAVKLKARADAIFTIEGASTHDGIRLVPSKVLASTNELAKLSDFEAVLAPLTNRTLALISTYAYGFDTNRLTKAASLLRECGFKEVRVIVTGWGMIFPGPAL